MSPGLGRALFCMGLLNITGYRRTAPATVLKD